VNFCKLFLIFAEENNFMEIEFTQEYLRELYENGCSTNKKYRFPKDIIKRYINTINKLRAARRTEDLYSIKSLYYKKLSGDKKEIEAVRINDKYRLEFISEVKGVITVCSIIEITNHYE